MRYLFGFLLALGLIVVVVVLLIRGFSGGSEPKERVDLSDFAQTSTLVSYTIDGPIISEEQHRGIRIYVSRSEARIEVYKGYQNNVITSKSHPNNAESYESFLKALQFAEFNVGSDDPNKLDERGYCAQGRRYIFTIEQGAEKLQRFWSTSCGGQGTFKGKQPTIDVLFKRQIPDYFTVTSGISL